MRTYIRLADSFRMILEIGQDRLQALEYLPVRRDEMTDIERRVLCDAVINEANRVISKLEKQIKKRK